MRGIIVILVAALAATTAMGAPAGKGKGPKGDRGGPQTRVESQVEVNIGVRGGGVSVGFGTTAQEAIRGYYAGKRKGGGGLPPGIAKNYARGKALPPGIAKKQLPPELEARLPVHAGYEYVVVNRDVLLISVRTGIVADIMIDIVL